jgi:CheY-like chemotaxis protein
MTTSPTSLSSPARPRILCVDDDSYVLAALQRQLRHRFDVVLACGGAAALERLSDAGPFAVIVSDLHMPGMDGYAFLAQAREIAPRTLAVLMTGCLDDGLPADGESDRVFRRITKPCEPEALWALLDAAVAQQALDEVEA